MKSSLLNKIVLFLLAQGGISQADIGLVHITGRPAVVYEENGMVFYHRCSKDDLEVNRNCRSVDEGMFSLSRNEFFDRLSMMAGLSPEVLGLDGLSQISTRLLRMEQLLEEAKDLSPEDLTQASATVEKLKKQQRRFVILQHRVMDFLQVKQSKVLDAVIRLREYEEVFFALFPQAIVEHRSTGMVYHVRYQESDIDNFAIKDQCKGGWRFPTENEMFINQNVMRARLGSVLLHDYPMGNYGVAKGLVWAREDEGHRFFRMSVLGMPSVPYQDRYLRDGLLDNYMVQLRWAKNLRASVVCIRDFSKDLPFWEGK